MKQKPAAVTAAPETAAALTDADFQFIPREGKAADQVVRPSVSYWADVFRRIRQDKVAMASLAVIAIIALMAIFAPMFSPYDYSTNDLSAINQPPSAEHWFGTDQLGRDLWARVWVGARVSLLIGLGGAIAPQIVGIFIGGEEQRSKGYGAEAIRLVLNYGFKTMNLHSINLTVHADNFAGISCYKKVGFLEVGRLPEVLFIDGKYVDKIYMSILEHEFSSDSNNTR